MCRSPSWSPWDALSPRSHREKGQTVPLCSHTTQTPSRAEHPSRHHGLLIEAEWHWGTLPRQLSLSQAWGILQGRTQLTCAPGDRKALQTASIGLLSW